METKDFTEEEIMALNLEDVKRNAKPCPFCGGNKLSFTYKSEYGHGESGFSNARIICGDCSGSKGDGHNYGSPSDLDRVKAYLHWNER
jgi:hypothetical protein